MAAGGDPPAADFFCGGRACGIQNPSPQFESGFGFVSPNSFANWVSSILAGSSLGRVQFLKRGGTSA